MQYRLMKKANVKVGVIGMGSAVIGEKPQKEIIKTVRSAFDHGVNYFDMAGGHATIFEAYGKALKDVRDKIFLQVHFGADYTSGEYGWTTDLKQIKKSISWQLEKLQTDYIDFGFIHCMDEEKDFEKYLENGVFDYIKELKEKGVVKHIGLSSHTPSVANKILDFGVIDALMFSINPLYDYGHGDYAFGSKEERDALYCRCEKDGIGIVVMKPFCGGQLLDEEKSPFKIALSQTQCIQYALDKPGVVCVVPGFGSEEELLSGLSYLSASENQRDYSIIGKYAPHSCEGRCVYCKHCHPCPMGLDIALINKYYDLWILGDNLAKEHYLTLEKRASDCAWCGHCDGRCPFKVKQSERMKQIAKEFGV